MIMLQYICLITALLVLQVTNYVANDVMDYNDAAPKTEFENFISLKRSGEHFKLVNLVGTTNPILTYLSCFRDTFTRIWWRSDTQVV